MKHEDLKTATNEAEFEQLLKEGKPFQLKAAHSITIAKLPGNSAPIVQVSGDSDEILTMFFYGLSEVAANMKQHGTPKEEILKMFHGAVDVAVDQIDIPHIKPTSGGGIANE